MCFASSTPPAEHRNLIALSSDFSMSAFQPFSMSAFARAGFSLSAFALVISACQHVSFSAFARLSDCRP
jgi:hypothetical protein